MKETLSLIGRFIFMNFEKIRVKREQSTSVHTNSSTLDPHLTSDLSIFNLMFHDA